MSDKAKQLLICPRRDEAEESQIEIFSVESIFDLIKAIENDAYVISIADVKISKMLVEYSSLFDVEVALLVAVPGADYDPAFENVTWGLDRVSYDALVLEAAQAMRMKELKDQERPKGEGNAPRNLTSEEIKDLKTPTNFDMD